MNFDVSEDSSTRKISFKRWKRLIIYWSTWEIRISTITWASFCWRKFLCAFYVMRLVKSRESFANSRETKKSSPLTLQHFATFIIILVLSSACFFCWIISFQEILEVPELTAERNLRLNILMETQIPLLLVSRRWTEQKSTLHDCAN